MTQIFADEEARRRSCGLLICLICDDLQKLNSSYIKEEPDMEKPKIVLKQDLKWNPIRSLPQQKSRTLSPIVMKHMDLTCMLVSLPVGTEVPKHTHECDDIVYVLKGKAKIWVDGVGDIPAGRHVRENPKVCSINRTALRRTSYYTTFLIRFCS